MEISLSERRQAAEHLAEKLRAQRGSLILDGRTTEDDRLRETLRAAESEIEALHAAEGEAARRERMELAAAEAARLAAVRTKLEITEEHRLEAVERAERAARELVGALSDARHHGVEETRMLRSLGVHPAMELDVGDHEQRLSMRLSAVMRRLSGLSGRFGAIQFSTRGDRRFESGWREAEQAIALPNIQKATKG